MSSRKSPVRVLLRELLAAVPRGRGRLILATLLAAGASGASVALLGVSGWLLSRAAEMPPVLFLQVAAVSVRFFGISRGVFRYLERLVGHDVALRMQGALRLRTYTKLAGTALIGRRRGDLLIRVIADVEAILDLVVRVIIPACAASMVILFTTVILGAFSPFFAVILAATAILAGLVLPWSAQRLSMRLDQAAVPARGQLGDEIHQLSRASTDLVAYGCQQASLDRVLEADRQLRQIELKSAWARGLATAGQIMAAGISVIAALLIGGQQVVDGTLAPVMLAVLVLTPLAMHEVLATFTQAAQTHTRARAALIRLVEVLEQDDIGNGDADQTSCAEPGVTLERVSAGWPGDSPVVEDLSFTVAPGQRVALVGPSGVGKTTVAATIMGLIPPLSGQIHSAGRVGYLAQDAHIFATTVAENILIGNRAATSEQIGEALELAGLPIDQDRMLGERGSTLSGGEARRLALARLLVGRRDLWILDEPTEHLDYVTASALMDDIWQLTRDQPVLVITHDPQVVLACDQVIRLS